MALIGWQHIKCQLQGLDCNTFDHLEGIKPKKKKKKKYEDDADVMSITTRNGKGMGSG